jgi:hypothetical protein
VKRTSFKQPESRPLPAEAEQWVANSEPIGPPVKPSPGVKPARLTIDLPEDLHARFKAACASKRSRMADEVRSFIEDWTQKNG